MRFTLKNSKFIQNVAFGATAIATLAGVGLASSPAQAGIFTLGPQTGPSSNPQVRDSEWGFPGDETIWSTFPSRITPGTGFDANPPETCFHGLTDCVNGWDNPLITHSGGGVEFKIEYFGSGTSTQTNNFLWNGDPLFGAHNGGNDGAPDPNNFGTLANGAIASPTFVNPVSVVPAVDGVLPLQFTTNVPTDTTVANGTAPTVDPNGNVLGPHYFATTKGIWADPTGDVVYLGFSDGNGGTGTSDDDAADFVVKITSVQKAPEPGTMLGLLAVGGLGVALKRKKQEG